MDAKTITLSRKDLVVYLLILALAVGFAVQWAVLEAKIGNARLINTVDVYDRNFTAVKTAIDGMSAAIKELQLSNQIKSNITGSGMVGKDNPPDK